MKLSHCQSAPPPTPYHAPSEASVNRRRLARQSAPAALAPAAMPHGHPGGGGAGRCPMRAAWDDEAPSTWATSLQTAWDMAKKLSRPWDAPLYVTSSWFHFLGNNLESHEDAPSGAMPYAVPAVVATAVVFPVTVLVDAINTVAFPFKIAARYLDGTHELRPEPR